MAWFSIGQVATRCGLRPSALRFYEQAGILTAATRVGGQRRYDARVFDRLAVIDYAKRVGFTLRETRLLLAGFDADAPASVRWRTLANRKREELDALIASARHMKRLLEIARRCDCPTLDHCGPRLRTLAAETGTKRRARRLQKPGSAW